MIKISNFKGISNVKNLSLTGVLLLFLNFISFAQDDLTWTTVRPIYLKAIETSIRTPIGDWWPDKFLDQVKTLQEKDEVIRLWILAREATYSDLIIPGIGIYLNLYDQAIRESNSDSVRQIVFVNELKGLLYILETLDKQIMKYIEYRNNLDADYSSFLIIKLGREPIYEDRINEEYWSEFLKKNPKYQTVPGFFSTTVATDKGNRSYEQYHAQEIQQLKEIFSNLPKNVSLNYYMEILEKFEGVLKYAKNNYM